MILPLLLALAAPAAAQPSADDSARIKQAMTAADAHDCATALRLVAPMLPPARAASLGPALFPALMIGAGCEAEARHWQAAYPLAVRATEAREDSPYAWRLRLAIELERRDTAAAVATLEALAAGRGAILNTVPIQWLGMVASRTRTPDQQALRERVLRIAALTYSPEPIDGGTDGFRLQYATLLLTAGKRAEAAEVLRGVTATGVMRDILVDPDLRATVPPGTDLKALSERELAANRALVEAYPDRLSPLLEVAANLRQLGRAQEALTLLEGARAKVTGGGYTDGADRQPWWWDALYRTQLLLGRPDDAVASLRSGMAVAEGGGKNVSQVINLMSVLNDLGRPQAALDAERAAGGIGDASPYGEMQLREARGCAHAQLGHAAEAAVERTYMEAHRRDAPAALGELLLCMGDLDAAAADVIARLGSIEDRADVLADFSTYAPPPVPLPPSVIERNRAKIALRPDVKAALARAGGTIVFPIGRTEH